MNMRDKAGTGAEGAPKGDASPEGAAKGGGQAWPRRNTRDKAGAVRRGGQGNEKRGRRPSFLFFLVDLGERVLEDFVAQGGEPGGEGDGVEGVGLVEVVFVG